jgi:GAF domain-containing protein
LYDKALDFYQKSAQVAQHYEDKNTMAGIYRYIGTIYQAKEDLNKAKKFLEDSKQLNIELKDKSGLTKSLMGLGKLMLQQQEFGKAQSNFEQAQVMLEELKETEALTEARVYLGIAYFKQRQYAQAIPYLENGIEAREIAIVKQSAQYLANAHEQLKQIAQSLQYHALFQRTADSMLKIQQTKQANFFKGIQLADSLKSVENKSYATYRNETQRNRLIIFIATALIIIILLAWLYRHKQLNNLKLQQANLAIGEQKERLQAKNENLSQLYQKIQLFKLIGQKITSLLDLHEITYTVYEEVKDKMDVAGFGVGIYDNKKQRIVFKRPLYQDRHMPSYAHDINNKDQLVVWCFDHKKIIKIDDLQNEHKQYVSNIKTESEYIENIGARVPNSILMIPLISHRKVIGVLNVYSLKKHAYNQDHLALFQNISLYITIALDNSRVYRKLENAYQSTRLLTHIGKQITSTLHLDQVLETIYEQINQLVDATNFGIAKYDAQNEQIVFHLAIKKGTKLEPYSLSTKDNSLVVTWCIRHKQPVKMGDLPNEYHQYVEDPTIEYQRPFERYGDSLPLSVMYIPLVIQQQVIGVLATHSFKKDAYSDYHLNVLSGLSSYVAVALDNAHKHEEVVLQKAEIKEQQEIVEAQNRRIKEAYQNIRLLTVMGQEVTASLDLHKIFQTVYEHIHAQMPTNNFSIGIYHPKTQNISFEFVMVNQEYYPSYQRHMRNKNQLAVWCVEHMKPIKMDDITTEYSEYVEEFDPSNYLPLGQTEIRHSCLYLPLLMQGKAVGVMAVLSEHKNAYTSIQYNLMKSLAVYVAIAVKNAQVHTQAIAQKEEIAKQNKELATQNNLINLLLNENQHRIGNDFVAMYTKVDAIGDTDLNPEAMRLVEQTKQRLRESMELQNLLSYPFHSQGQTCDQYEIYDRLYSIAQTLLHLHFGEQHLPNIHINNEVELLDKNRLVMIAFCVFELVKNVCKHAFPKQHTSPDAMIDLQLTKAKEVTTLTLKNTGKGFKPSLFDEQGQFNFNQHSTSKGMSIIRAITHKEKGHFMVRSTGIHPDVEVGSLFVCTFGGLGDLTF